MKLRVIVATGAIAVTLTTLSACASDDAPEAITAPETSATPPVTSQAPSVDPDTEGAIALRGDWEIPSEKYVLHLIEDGTFIEDFDGVKDFLTGKYSVEGDTISLVGDDGNTLTGKIVEDTLVFDLGTATRVK